MNNLINKYPIFIVQIITTEIELYLTLRTYYGTNTSKYVLRQGIRVVAVNLINWPCSVVTSRLLQN
jgi:hypothetical protein